MTQHSAEQDQPPILFLDTCSVLDLLRDPTRQDANVQEQRASLCLLGMAETGTTLEVRVAEQVRREYAAGVEIVQEEATLAFKKLRSQIQAIDKVVMLQGGQGEVVLAHWDGHQRRCRLAADRWMEIAKSVPTPPDVEKRAFWRVSEGIPPAGRGKNEMKDCVILETYLDYMRGLRMSSARAAVFVSSNTRDFANDRKNEVATQLRDEFCEVDLKYAPNMRIARGLLGLLRPKTPRPPAGESDN